MPKEVFDKDYRYLPHGALLSFEELERLARIFVAQGVKKLRLTGGEPLLRKNLEVLIAMLARLRQPNGAPVDVTLTTNGALLAKKAVLLKEAGLTRLTVSLDGLDDSRFQQMNDVGFPVGEVLHGIEAAETAGFTQMKINMVVKKGVNEDQIIPMAEYFKGRPHILRFIEYMDVGSSNGWKMEEVLPSAELVQRISRVWPLEALESSYAGEVAQRWRYADGSGEIGVISSVTRAFCKDCTRARLSTDGKLYACLFAQHGTDIKTLLRGGATDAELASALAQFWRQRDDRYSELRSAQTPSTPKIEMSYIGG